jgi:hypothetical protein
VELFERREEVAQLDELLHQEEVLVAAVHTSPLFSRTFKRAILTVTKHFDTGSASLRAAGVAIAPTGVDGTVRDGGWPTAPTRLPVVAEVAVPGRAAGSGRAFPGLTRQLWALLQAARELEGGELPGRIEDDRTRLARRAEESAWCRRYIRH